MRALAYLAAGLVVFLGVAVAIVPGDARTIVLPAVIVAALILVVLIGVQLARPDEDPTDPGTEA